MVLPLLHPNHNAFQPLIVTNPMNQFSEIYSMYYGRLLRFAEDFVLCREDAENIIQDVFLDLWKLGERLRDIDNINAYLFRVVRNRCYDFLKHQVHVKAYEADIAAELRAGMETLDAMTDEECMLAELLELVKITVANFPPRCREVFLLSRLEGLRHSEIAAHLGITENTVGVQLGIALRRLRAVTDSYIKCS